MGKSGGIYNLRNLLSPGDTKQHFLKIIQMFLNLSKLLVKNLVNKWEHIYQHSFIQ